MLEDVKAMVSGKVIGVLNLWQNELARLGYENFAQVLNSKSFNVPQNRERIFLISIRIDDTNEIPKFHFPKPRPLELCLGDVLEEDVEEKYFSVTKCLQGSVRKVWKKKVLYPFRLML